MRRSEFEAMMEEQFNKMRSINQTKGHDYAGDEDALANFKDEEPGTLQAIMEAHGEAFVKWYVYFRKHYAAFYTFMTEGAVKSEPIDGRIDDLLVYLVLLKGLIHEERMEKLINEPVMQTPVGRPIKDQPQA